jgi:L-asparagine transporter-like permease
MHGADMNRMFQFRLPTHPVLRALTLAALAALAVVLFFLGAVIWLTLLAVGLVAALILRLFGARPAARPGAGDVIEGEYKVLDSDDRDGPSRRRDLP